MKAKISHIAFFLLISLVSLSSCKKHTIVESMPEPVSDYQIWSVVLDSLGIGSSTTILAIGDTTFSLVPYSDQSDSLFRLYVQTNIPSIDIGVLDDFLSKNKLSRKIDPLLSLRNSYVLLSKHKVQTDFTWYTTNYPNAGHFITISRPGYNSDFSQALVSIDFFWPMAGHGEYCYLTRTANGWVIQKTLGSWVS